MTDLRTAAQQALEAWQTATYGHPSHHKATLLAMTALRAALAQQDEATGKSFLQVAPVQEPVAWNWMLDGLPYGRACYGDPPDADLAERAATAGRTVRLLYTAPPQRLPLTEEEIVDAVREADLDWQKGWTLDETQSNRFVTLARAVERAHGIKE